MTEKRTVKTRNFHQAKWDESIIFELSNPGEKGIKVPETEVCISKETGEAMSLLPEKMRRTKPPALPEISQMRVLKHYLRISQHCLGADFNVDIGQGTCTMKYSPKINEVLVRSPKAAALHPFQDDIKTQ